MLSFIFRLFAYLSVFFAAIITAMFFWDASIILGLVACIIIGMLGSGLITRWIYWK